MNVSSTYGVTVAVSAENAGTSVATLQGQVSSLTKQIEATQDDTKLDCKVKDSRLGTLRSQLARVQEQLQQARRPEQADDAQATQDRTASQRTRQDERSQAAARRGGVDVYA